MARRHSVTAFGRAWHRTPRRATCLPPRRPDRRHARAGQGLILALLSLAGPRAGDRVKAGVAAREGRHVRGIAGGDTLRMRCPGPGPAATRLGDVDRPDFDTACTRERVLASPATGAPRWQAWRAGEMAGPARMAAPPGSRGQRAARGAAAGTARMTVAPLSQRRPGAVTYRLGNTPDLHDAPIALIRLGRKRATFTAQAEIDAGAPPSEIGRCAIVEGFAGVPQRVVRRVEQRRLRCDEMTEEMVPVPGVDETPAAWRAAHLRHFRKLGIFAPDNRERFEPAEDLA